MTGLSQWLWLKAQHFASCLLSGFPLLLMSVGTRSAEDSGLQASARSSSMIFLKNSKSSLETAVLAVADRMWTEASQGFSLAKYLNRNRY